MTVDVLFLGLDGATFTVLDPLMAAGVMPNLRRISESGVRSPMQTVMPPLTPPLWRSTSSAESPAPPHAPATNEAKTRDAR